MPDRLRFSRRLFLARAAPAGTVCALAGLAVAKDASLQTPPSAFDRVLEVFMKERLVPGGALAVIKDQHLIHARGFGWAERETQSPARPDSLFRLASLSKPLTGLAILKLAEQDRLMLDARIHELLHLENHLDSAQSWDRRWQDITVRHLLHHTGGWDAQRRFDPMFRSAQIKSALCLESMPGTWDIIRFMLREPLDFQPGARYAYSNFGYCLLGRIIEAVTGKPYQTFVQHDLLQPLGISQMRVGSSRLENRAPGEVRYYLPDKPKRPGLFPDQPGLVPSPYGGFQLETMDAHGGWIASVLDLAKLTAALSDPQDSPLLEPDSFALLKEPPSPPVARTEGGALQPAYYGCGWMVRPAGAAGRPNYWHHGSLPGTYTLWVRRGDGISYIALFNQRSDHWEKKDMSLDPLLYQAADQVRAWPEGDRILGAPPD